jgi:hypothetical protein
MLMLQGLAYLPDDFWEWYLLKAGRSELTNSWLAYFLRGGLRQPPAVCQKRGHRHVSCSVPRVYAELVSVLHGPVSA